MFAIIIIIYVWNVVEMEQGVEANDAAGDGDGDGDEVREIRNLDPSPSGQ